MSYLLDTNILAVYTSKKPERAVLEWLDSVPGHALHLSVLTLGDIRKGAELAPDPRFRERLRQWLEHELPVWFEDRILGIDAAVADRWGRLSAQAGRTLPAIDGLLAATALEHDLVLATRNEQDFFGLPVQVLNPWLA